jgi:hypothetical protein
MMIIIIIGSVLRSTASASGLKRPDLDYLSTIKKDYSALRGTAPGSSKPD